MQQNEIRQFDEVKVEEGSQIPDTSQKMKQINNLMIEKKYQEAEELLDQYINDNQANSEAYQKRAEVYLKTGKYIQALHDQEKAILLDPTKECCKSSFEHYQIKKGLMRMSNDI